MVSTDSRVAAGAPRSDAELLRAHVAGDAHAFAELFARHRHRLLRLAIRRSVTPEDAADAMQDAMLAAHRSAAGFRHQAAVGSWLYRIVSNACVDRRRSASTRLERCLVDDAHPVSDHTAQVETAILVRSALMRLPVAQRAAVLAVDMHGYSVAEAARLLGVAEGTVKSRRARARAQLLGMLGPRQQSAGAPGGH